jgi:carbon-monoxide dehydrogenase medium subunit
VNPAPKLIAQRSRHRIHPFRLHRPTSAQEAVSLYKESAGPAAYMAGGIDLIAGLKMGAPLDDLIFLEGLPEWTSIVARDDAFLIGAGATHQRLAADAAVQASFPGLCQAWSRLANHRIRNKGTVGGNLMSRNSAYDFPVVALAAGAQLHVLDPTHGARQLAADDLVAVSEGTLLTHIALPRTQYIGFAVQLEWKPVLAFALSVYRDQRGMMGRLAIGCGYSQPACATQPLDDIMITSPSAENAAMASERLCSDLPEPLGDWRASADYRGHLLRVLVRREIEQMQRRAYGA